MNKKTAIVIIGGIIVAVLVILALSKNSKQKTESSVLKNELTSEEIAPSAQTKEYIDPAGFKFSYPSDLSVEKKDTDNKDSYSFLSLTSEQYSGTLSLNAVATEAAVLDDLMKNNKELQNNNIKKIKVADLNALQYELGNKIITLALDKGVLFTITSVFPEQKKYWSKAHEKIIQSFAFTPPANNSGSTSPGNAAADDSISYEGEEIIE
ncbi:MAG: hypothetical protein HYW86_04325 [Candidatus Roizmanbacteria bacterium]|nr:MAG: hypothetical protein HYW86_04325 [Candidatus Roizmanbacteria bacterium]